MVWRYDFGLRQRLWPGATMDLDVRGGEGDDPAVRFANSTMNTNQYAGTPNEGFILHLWVEQKLWDEQLTLRGGKLDLGDWMDVNRFGYYNLLGFSQNHNPAIPFPGNPLAAMITVEPKSVSWLYASAGVANAEQSSLTGGFHELREGKSSLFAMGELGLKLNFNGQPGIYRFIGWYDGRDLAPIGGKTGETSDGRYGVALSFDQNLTRDLGLFARYGLADQSEFNPRHSWQVGFDWKGVVPGRPKDDLAVGLVQNVFDDARKRVVRDASEHESYLEAYYNYVAYDWLQVQPVFQMLHNPGGVERSPAWIVGVHVAIRL
jgi:carbohydrate-selective porin OprB